MLPAFGVPLSAEGLSRQSRALFDIDFRYIRLNPETGYIPLPCGHLLKFVCAATVAGVYDANGATYTAMVQEPAWEMRDWDGDGIRESFGVYVSTDGRFSDDSYLRPMAMSGLLEMIETGQRTDAANRTFFAHANSGATGAGFWIDTTATEYRFNYNDGSTLRQATLSGGTSASGDRLRFLWELASDGAVTFSLSINEGPEIVATSAALALPAAWASSSEWKINRRGGSSANNGFGWYRRCKVVAGILDPVAIVERR